MDLATYIDDLANTSYTGEKTMWIVTRNEYEVLNKDEDWGYWQYGDSEEWRHFESFDSARAHAESEKVNGFSDQMLGMESVARDGGGFLYRSPTGFPLAEMFLCEGQTGKLEPYFGQPVALHKDWIKEHQS